MLEQRLIVATRFILASALITPKQALGVAQRYAGRITRNTDPVELRRVYLEMAEQIRPLASLLQDVVIQRSDEARKLKNVQQWLRAVARNTDPKWIADIPDDELDIALPMGLESLIGALKSLARVESRLTGYAAVEKNIPHGRYEIINRHGYRPDEYAGAIKILDSASDVITRAGFGQAVYGKVTLDSEPGASWAGKYSYNDDLIRLNMGANHREGTAVYSLVHELGHRIWFKFLSPAQQDYYEDSYFGTAPLSFSLKDRELFWKVWEEAAWDARVTRARLPKELEAAFTEYLADFKKHNVMPGTKGIQISPEMLRRQFVKPSFRHFVLDHKSLSSVTDYGQTNVLEDFAEVFAYHCTGRKLTPDASERFYQATGKR